MIHISFKLNCFHLMHLLKKIISSFLFPPVKKVNENDQIHVVRCAALAVAAAADAAAGGQDTAVASQIHQLRRW